MPIALLPCRNEGGVPGPSGEVKFVDRHNGWGLTALHIAVFQGSVNTGAPAPAARPVRLSENRPGRLRHDLRGSVSEKCYLPSVKVS